MSTIAGPASKYMADELFTPAYYQAYITASAYTASLLYDLFHQMGLAPLLSVGATLDVLTEAIKCSPSQKPLLEWGLYFLIGQGWLQRIQDDNEFTYRRVPAVGEEMPIPFDEPFIAEGMYLLNLAATVWPSILSGSANGMRALFRGEGIEFWERYFHANHPLYNVHNLWGANAVAALLPQGGRLIELGVGFGSAARALVQHPQFMERQPVEYLLSDVNLLLARRAASSVVQNSPTLTVRSTAIDFDRPVTEQGIEPGYADVIYACNALHCAADLPRSLTSIRKALRHGGRLILSECARQTPQNTLHQEFIFMLLASYRQGPLDSESPFTFGFLTPDGWRSLLLNAGFESVEVTTNQSSEGDPILGVLVTGVAP